MTPDNPKGSDVSEENERRARELLDGPLFDFLMPKTHGGKEIAIVAQALDEAEARGLERAAVLCIERCQKKATGAVLAGLIRMLKPPPADRGEKNVTCRNPQRPGICLCPASGLGYGPRQVLASAFINSWLSRDSVRSANALARDAAVTEEQLWERLFALESDASGALQFWRNSQ